jgi:prepilin-type N-terminal cleavage/methylation domain-containing protein
MKTSASRTTRAGFSLVEVLTAAVLLGILSFIAIPNIVRMKQDSEVNLAIARAEAVNMSLAAYLQANGRSVAVSTWTTAANASNRYALLKPYLAFAPESFSDYMPDGYVITLPTSVASLQKVTLKTSGDSEIVY